ncbi:MAG: DUF2752 domain-containing protein [bacterium]|nr:DUF2752 domain-containing protein [bacterium]
MSNRALHIEWMVFLGGLILMGTMNPYTVGTSWCLFDIAGFEFCLGEGLGHSIAFTVRGNFEAAFGANIMGPFTVALLSFRILMIWKSIYINYKKETLGTQYV